MFHPLFSLQRFSVSLLCLASCLLLAAWVAASAQDDPLQHYKAAETFAEKGDQTHAVAEYKVFLSEEGVGTVPRPSNRKLKISPYPPPCRNAAKSIPTCSAFLYK